MASITRQSADPSKKQNNSYYERANPDLLFRIPVQARRVLEVGCGAGALGAAYKRINPDAQVVGLELNAQQAERARTHLDHVLNVDVDHTPTPPLPDGLGSAQAPFDCLVYGDVLEHLREPQEVLRQQLKWLAADGLVLACIPNVQHWSVLLNLLAGRWPQQDQGLFDRTHLRWFTRDSMIKLMQSCGLKVYDITPRVFQPDQARALVDKLAPVLPQLGIDTKALLAGVSPLQYVIRAGRRPVEPLLISGMMLKAQLAMNDVRMIQPLRSVASSPGVVMELTHQQPRLLPASSEMPRILIFQRQGFTHAKSLPQLRMALRSGTVLVGEFDDDPNHFPTIAANHHLPFKAMHAMQVSTEPLAEEMRQYNPEVATFPNAIEILPAQTITWPTPGNGQPLRLFFGAANRGADWAPWIDALNQVFNADRDGWWVEVVHDQAFFDALQTPCKTFTPTCSYAKYKQVMARCHVAFLPLADTRFNRMKSDLKFVEAASHGLAVVASDVVYGASLEQGQTGVTVSRPSELMDCLREWRHHPERGERIGLQARAWVSRCRLQKHQSAQREAWYRQLWSKREQLTAALLERVPELRDE